ISLDDPSNTTYGAVADVICDSGFEHSVYHVICLSNGLWSEASCAAKITLDDRSNTTYDSTADIICDIGFDTSVDHVTCLSNGSWSEASCLPKDCGAVDVPVNGQVENPEETTFQKVALFKCNIGYDLIGNGSRLCIVNLSGEMFWTENTPNCQVKDCKALSSPENGRVNIPSGTTYHQNATYTCNNGYELIGDRVRQCIKSRRCRPDGSWERPQYNCNISTCKKILGLVDSLGSALRRSNLTSDDTSVTIIKTNVALEVKRIKNEDIEFPANDSSDGALDARKDWIYNSNSKLMLDDNALEVCECNHLTNFAVLMSPFVQADAESIPLRIISIVGIAVSMLCLLLTYFVYICLWRNIKNDRAVFLLNLCIALLFSCVVFLAGVDRTESNEFCKVVAGLLHYLYLVVFCLMLAEGIDMAYTVLYVFATRSRARSLVIASWVSPAVIVGITLGVTQTQGYGNTDFCWLSILHGVIWAFVAPALLIILISLNILCLVLVFNKMLRMKAMETKKMPEKIKTSLRSLCVLVPLMGVSWILGIFYINEDFYSMQYLFSICNGLQKRSNTEMSKSKDLKHLET
ncbi:adhesion G protein-coupled receptor L3-like, partial [Mya arenaria]|uniref:adhesion G protein-coupled receptor L3-like n=1 Tax=Mya arenaria TaxID=6604 RepID=UPI0022E8E45B